MALKQDLEKLVRALFEEKYNSSELKNLLSSIVDFPNCYSKEAFESWKTRINGLTDMFKQILTETTTEGSLGNVKAFLSNLTSNRELPEKNRDQILRDVTAFVSSLHSKSNDMERVYKNENPGGDLENASHKDLKARVAPSKFIKDLVEMVKGGKVSQSAVREYIQANAQGRLSEMYREARSQGYDELVSIMTEGYRVTPKMASAEFGNVLDAFGYRLKVDKFKDLYLSSGETGHRQLYSLLGNLNTVSVLTGLSLEEIKKELQNEKVQKSFGDFFADDLARSKTLAATLKSGNVVKKILDKTREMLNPENLDNKAITNPRGFTNQIMMEVREKLKKAHLENLEKVFGSKESGNVPEELYKAMERVALGFATNELAMFSQHYELRSVKIGDKEVQVPVFYRMPGIYRSGTDRTLYQIVRLLKADKILEKNRREDHTSLARSKGGRYTEKRLQESALTYPGHFKHAKRLIGYYGYANLRAALRRDKFLTSRKSLERIAYLSEKIKTRQGLTPSEKKELAHYNARVDSLVEKDGTITLGKLFIAASEDIQKKKKDPFHHPRHLIALMNLSEMTGTTKSKWLVVTTQAMEMMDILEREAKGSGMSIEDIIERVDIGELPSTSIRPAGKGDERGREKWDDPGMAEHERKMEYVQKVNALKVRRDVIAKYSGTHFDHRGRPKSSLYKELFKGYEKMYESDPDLKRRADNMGGVYPAFKSFMESRFAQSQLRDMRARELLKAMEDPEFKRFKTFEDSACFYEKYVEAQKLFTTSPGSYVCGKWVPLALEKTMYSREGRFVRPARQKMINELRALHLQLEHIETVYQNKVTLNQKFIGMTFVGRLEASTTIKELKKNLAFIYSYIPEKYLNEFQEDLGDMSISKIAERRSQELQGLTKNQNVTSAS